MIGVVVSGIVGFLGWLRHRLRRRNQIGYFRKLIVEGYKKFHLDYSSLPRPTDARRAVFEETYREVQAALQGRSDDMTFDQGDGALFGGDPGGVVGDHAGGLPSACEHGFGG